MRRLHLLALVAPVLFLPLACEDSSSSPQGNFELEAGPGFDAGGLAPDGSVTPGMDASVPDSAPTPKGVSVTVVTSAGLPAAAVRVLFHDTTGAVSGEMTTGATGKVATATVPSMITVLAAITTGFPRYAPVTYLGVADGDNLIVVAPALIDEESAFAHLSVSLTAGAVVANASSFVVQTGGSCFGSANSTETPIVVDLYSNCLANPNALLTTASNISGNLGFGFMKGIAKPAANATVNIGPLAFTAPETSRITASNLPDSETYNSFATLNAIANGGTFQMNNINGTLDDGGLTYSTPAGFADAWQSVVEAQRHQLPLSALNAIVRRDAAGAPANVTVDFATALPFLTSAAFTTAGTFASGVTVTPAAALTGADAGVVSISWDVPESPAGGPATGQWTFVLPPSTTTFKPPTLPMNAAAFVPTSNARISNVIYFDASQIPGYSQAKALPISSDSGANLTDTSHALPSNGSVRISSLFIGPQEARR